MNDMTNTRVQVIGLPVTVAPVTAIGDILYVRTGIIGLCPLSDCDASDKIHVRLDNIPGLFTFDPADIVILSGVYGL